MSLLIANIVKTNMCLVVDQFCIVCTIYVCQCFQLDACNNNYNNICLTVILLCSHPLRKQQHLFVLCLEVEFSRLRLLENSIATSLLFVYGIHIACCCVLDYLPIPFSFMMLFTSKPARCSSWCSLVLMLNYGTPFPFS